MSRSYWHAARWLVGLVAVMFAVVTILSPPVFGIDLDPFVGYTCEKIDNKLSVTVMVGPTSTF